MTLRAPYGEVHTSYGERLAGTQSKLASVGDRLRIMKTILKFYMLERPREFYLLQAVGGAIPATGPTP